MYLYVLTNLIYYLYIYTKEFSWMYFVNWNISNFNVLIYFIIFVYAMISCGKYYEMRFFLCLKILDLHLATLQF